MNENTKPAIFCCSPRRGGNSDAAGRLLAEGVEDAGGTPRMIHLRDYAILPCIGCGRCRKNPQGRCFQERSDQSRDLFSLLFAAPVIFFSSPIFFYHLPAHFKSFIDRGQSFYLRKMDQDPSMLSLPPRQAYLTMVAGRPRGKKLFEGSVLTLRTFLDIFHIQLQETLAFRGIDEVGDLESNPEHCQEIRGLGSRAWTSCLEKGQ